METLYAIVLGVLWIGVPVFVVWALASMRRALLDISVTLSRIDARQSAGVPVEGQDACASAATPPAAAPAPDPVAPGPGAPSAPIDIQPFVE